MHPSTQAVISSFQQLLKQSAVSKIQLQKKITNGPLTYLWNTCWWWEWLNKMTHKTAFLLIMWLERRICLNPIKAGYCWGEWIVTKSNLAKGFLHLFLHYSIKGGEAILDDQYFLFSSTLTEVEIRKLLHKQHKEFRCNKDHLSGSSGVW